MRAQVNRTNSKMGICKQNLLYKSGYEPRKINTKANKCRMLKYIPSMLLGQIPLLTCRALQLQQVIQECSMN